jgi:hypothetical protein
MMAHRLLSQDLEFECCVLGDVKQTRPLAHLLKESSWFSN